jgi:hypothetical protein
MPAEIALAVEIAAFAVALILVVERMIERTFVGRDFVLTLR